MTEPLTPEEFAALLEPLSPAFPLACAVSGGADSTALALLAHAWAGAGGGQLIALTVDHGLRPESAAEAAQVAQWMRARGIPHHVLRWEERPQGNVQLAAREARYRLMAEFCEQSGIRQMLLAHHLDDQAETVLLRLKRGSHIAGLAAMAPVSQLYGLTLLRPLLPVPRARLIATLRAARHSWIEDPSNADPAFERVRLRAMLAALPNRDAVAAQLAAAAERLRPLKQAAAEATAAFLAAQVRFAEGGAAECSMAALEELGTEEALRALSRLLQQAGGAAYPPRFAEAEALFQALKAAAHVRRTLAGCLVERRKDRLRIRRERA